MQNRWIVKKRKEKKRKENVMVAHDLEGMGSVGGRNYKKQNRVFGAAGKVLSNAIERAS